jgi:hypothetical protein
MLRDACEFLRREQMPEGDIVADDGNIGPVLGGLVWLSTGEPRYLMNAVHAAYWYKEQCEAGKSGWCWTQGYGGLLLTEYYHMTGDKNILPGIEKIADILARGQMPSGGWSHGGYSGFGAGYGEVNCAGMICYMALLEARECGVKVDEAAIARAERLFEYFAPTLSAAYGNHGVGINGLGYSGKNGKIGGQAIAHRLNNKSEYSSLYALKAARSMDTVRGGHTGHFFNVMWSSIAASVAPAREYRSAMDQLGWYFTLSRHWRGGLFCQPNERKGSKYSTEGGVNMTTGGYGMILATPRRHLRILGAPRGVFTVKLPEALEAARSLHQSRRYDAAIAAVDAFLKNVGHDSSAELRYSVKETVRLANELRDKSRYVKAGIEEAYLKLEELASGSERGPRMGSRPVKASGIIRHLRNLVGDDDARINAVEKSFPAKFRGIWRHGESYHQAFRTLRALNTRPWFIYASLLEQTVPDFAMPADYPAWKPLADPLKGVCKAAVFPEGKEPRGWADIDFDDSSWKTPKEIFDANRSGRRNKGRIPPAPKGSRYLVRVPFDMKNPSVTQLRIRYQKGGAGLAAGGNAYINGTCVLETFAGVGYRGKVTLLDNARYLLQKGKNVCAYSSPGDLPQPALDADGVSSIPLEWTVDPDRDAEFRTLVAKRRVPEPYYVAGQDQRTPQELMAAFTAEPFVVPDAYNALDRFEALLPRFRDRTRYVTELMNSPNWGSRWCALVMLCRAMEDPGSMKGVSAEAKKEETKNHAAACAWAKTFAPEVVKLVGDPHFQVRKEAASAARLLGSTAKAAIPALAKLVEDVDGQTWPTRHAAFRALQNMPVDETARQAIVRAGLKDPDSIVR